MSRPAVTSASAALATFVAVAVAAVPLYLVLGRDQWFFLDDWAFLTSRSLRSADDLLRPHNEHWTTLPIIAFRALWRIVGIRSYVPYQLMTITLHVAAAVLLRLIMRRAGVSPWIATAAASLFVLFGAGRQNIVWSFQISFAGSLVAGLAQLVLADHDGPFRRRDAIGLVFGVAGLLCSAAGITSAAVVGTAVLLRRGWRLAAMHTLPLGLVFTAWWLGFGRGSVAPPAPFADELRYVRDAIVNIFEQLGQAPGVAIALGAVTLVGSAMVWTTRRAQMRRELAVPVALLAGVFVFAASLAQSRAGLVIGAGARSSRYVHFLAAMALPGIAVACQAVADRWRRTAPALVALLLLGVPGNVGDIRGSADPITLGDRRAVLALQHSRFAHVVPPSTETFGRLTPGLTIGWLLDGAGNGRVPRLAGLTRVERADADLRLAVQQEHADGDTGPCRPLDDHVDVRLAGAEVIDFRGGDVVVQLRAAEGVRSHRVRFELGRGDRLRALAGPVDLTLLAASPGVSVCR